MHSFSLWHWIIFLIIAAVPLWLFSHAIRKAGFSPWWAVLGIVPVVNIIMLWVFAYTKWPALPEEKTDSARIESDSTTHPVRGTTGESTAAPLPAGLQYEAKNGASTGSRRVALHPSASLPNDKTARTTSNSDPSEEVFWAMALVEFQSSERKHGLWAKAYADAQGSEALAKANYLRWRAYQLIEEHRQVLLNESRAREQLAHQAKLAQTRAHETLEERAAKVLSSSAEMCTFLQTQGFSIVGHAGRGIWNVTNPSGVSQMVYGQDELARLVEGLLKQPHRS